MGVLNAERPHSHSYLPTWVYSLAWTYSLPTESTGAAFNPSSREGRVIACPSQHLISRDYGKDGKRKTGGTWETEQKRTLQADFQAN